MKKIIATTLTLILLVTAMMAQQNGWIEQELAQSMSGQSHVDCDDDLIIYTKSNSDVVYVFDMNLKAWTAIQFPETQVFSKTIADQQTAFAYSEEYLFGYSSILSAWDTLKYQGNVIDPTGVSTLKGFGCAGKLAYFVTDANYFYVFDAELGQWQEYNFGIVLNASGNNNFWAADNFAGAILGRKDYDFAKNIAYSLVTHSFAELDQGGWYYHPDNNMTGGYVSTWQDTETTVKHFGYSATTSEFKTVTFPIEFNVTHFSTWMNVSSFDLFDELFVYSCGYVIGDQFHRDLYRESYSTKTGQWYSQHYGYDPSEISDGGGGYRGGCFIVSPYRFDDEDQTFGLWKFYGNTGTHIGEMPDLFKSVAFICGGKVAVGFGDHNLWFHNFETTQTKNIYYPPDDNVFFEQSFAAENYCSISRIDNTSDIMKVFFYNANTNKLHTIDAHKEAYTMPVVTKRGCGYATGGPQNEVIFYSEILDTVVIYHASEAHGGLSAYNFLIAHEAFGAPVTIFDASTAQIYEKDIQLFSTSIGDSLIFVTDGNTKLTAYNAINKTWVDYQTDQQLNGYHVGDVVGIGYSVSFEKYWGYSANLDHFYPLVPEGSFVSPYSMAGGKTGIVIRTEKIYAFCPNTPDGIDDNYLNQKPAFSLSQNSPNPFEQQTTINYELYKPARVELSVYDAYGNSLQTLVKANQNTGEHSIVFNTGNLASGIYYLRLTSNNHSQVKKMIVLR